MNSLKNNLASLLILTFVLVTFFAPVWQEAKLPIPADTIAGLYHPFRDLFANEFPSGIPYKNFLLTDPVRQQFLWKKLAIQTLKAGEIPWWNPFTHSGTPLLAGMQAGVFYPLNFVFFFLEFTSAWTLFIVSQSVLAALFAYWFLKSKKLHPLASLLGALSFVFGGFFMVWLEWGNIGHTILWLPLLFLSVDKIIAGKNKWWNIIFLFSLVSQFFAGHLQTSFYLLIAVIAYIVYKLSSLSKSQRSNLSKRFVLYFVLFAAAAAIQWLPTLQFINLSARSLDQTQILTRSDWFLPWPHLIQLIAPDFFGNPATLNYWGEWNYAEFVGFIGVIPLIFALGALTLLKKGDTRFFTWIIIISLLFALPTPIARLPFLLKLPFLSQAQPSRLLSLVTFSLAMLAAFGFDQFLRKKSFSKSIQLSIGSVGLTLSLLWAATLANSSLISSQNLSVAHRNLILPTAMFLAILVAITGYNLAKKFSQNKSKKLFSTLAYFLLLLAIGDQLRFAQKFTPFSSREYLFPQTKVIDFLQKDPDLFRIISLDRRIMPPNFSLAYGLQTIEGYDPLYLKAYAHLITQLETGERKETPIAFNRIISPTNIDSKLINRLNVKYVLTLTEIEKESLKLVFQEGETRVYQNTRVLPRARFTQGEGRVEVVDYSPHKIILSVQTNADNVLELADMMYPGWQAKINGQTTPVWASQENFRQVNVSAGEHEVIFFYSRGPAS